MVDDEEVPDNRQRLAAELRRLRDRAGLSGRQLAERIGMSQSKVSRIESGRTLPNVPEVTAWAAAVHASDPVVGLLTALADAARIEVLPWHAALRGRVHIQDEIQELESRASVRLYYQPLLIPGMLQTAEYARRVFTMFDPAYAETDIPAIVAARQDRQVALFDPAQRFAFLITEGALRWRVGPAEIMLAQLDRILSLATLVNVSILFIPQAAPALTHVPHGFVLFEPAEADSEPLVMVETVHANLSTRDPVHIALYRRQWALLNNMAVAGDEARDLVARVAADIRALPPADTS